MRALTLNEALIYGRGVERPFLCPEHGDSRPSASVNTIKKVWYCYTCHAHGDLTGEARLSEPNYAVMKNWIDERLDEGHVYPESPGCHDGTQVRYTTTGSDAVGRAATTLPSGADPDTEPVTYPLRDPAGGVLGVVRRRLLAKPDPKYRYPKGIDVGGLLFNYSQTHVDRVVLVEGALDAIALWNVGVSGDRHLRVPAVGCPGEDDRQDRPARGVDLLRPGRRRVGGPQAHRACVPAPAGRSSDLAEGLGQGHRRAVGGSP